MEKQLKLNTSKEVINFLAERFPQCFCAEGEARPLKIGIFQDLVHRVQGEMGLSKTQLRSALRLYTSSWRYLHGIKAGAMRVDLEGNACGVLEEQHVEHAQTQLKEAKARVQAQRELKQAKNRESVQEASAGRAGKLQRPEPADKKKQKRNVKTRVPDIGQKSATAPDKQSLPVQTITDTSALQTGQKIKVKAGKNAMDATILEISKEGVRVQLTSGLAMIVRAEHLQF